MVIRRISIFTLLANSILLVSAESDPVDYRLENIYLPLTYDVKLSLGSELFTQNGTQFSGEVKIGFRFLNYTDHIALHSHHTLNLDKVALGDLKIPSSNYSLNNVTDILTIKLERSVVLNLGYVITIKYTGIVSTGELVGFYKSSYVDRNGETKYLVTTAPGYVRRIFPCFDEPAYKAYFNYEVTFPSSLNALFNTRELSKITNEDNGYTTIIFYRSPKMATGSLALVVSDLTCSSVDHIIRIQVCSRDETASQRKLALTVTPKLLEALIRFTNFSYSPEIGKLDIVAVPDFPTAAAENWGLQIHGETDLLSDDVESSNSYKEDTTLVLAHELAHQWFGNLITYYWYSEVFMEEGFARFFEYFIVNEVYPQYESERRLVMRHLRSILVPDGTGTAMPLHIENLTMTSIWDAYNPIAYDKGGSILRMVSYFMSMKNFKIGLQNYIKKYQYDNVDSEDLWTELNKTIVDSVSKMPANLSTVMRSWIWETGYPLLTVSLNGENLTVSQSRFLYSGPDNKTKWYIPVSYTESAHLLKFQSTTPDFWVTPDSDFHTHIPSGRGWLILNNQQIGYYRVKYDDNLWGKIKVALEKEEFDGIADMNRAQIIDDLFSFARADIMPYSSVLDSIRFLKNETSYYPWRAATDGFEFLLRRVGQDTELGTAIKADLLGLIGNFYSTVPIRKRNSSDHSYTRKQELAADWACRTGHEDCIKDAARLFKLYKDFGKRPPQDLRYIIYCNALRYSEDDSDWYFMWEALLKSKQPSETKITRWALGCSRNTTLLKFYLQQSITKDSGIRSQDALFVFTSVGAHPEGVNVAFDFMIENQNQIVEHYQTINAVEFIFVGLPDRLTSKERIQKLIDLVNSGNLNEEFKRHGEQAVFAAESTAAWLNKYSDDLSTYYNLDTFNYNYLFFLFLIPVIIGLICGYFYCTRRECFLAFMRNLDPRNWLARIRQMNIQVPQEDIPMRER